MSETFDFEFEELPLLTKDGVQAGLVNGEAEILVFEDGEWTVGEIRLEGYEGGNRKLVQVEKFPGTTELALYQMIWAELENGSFRPHIQDRVEAFMDDIGIVLRSDRREHGTYHNALQGIR